MPGKELQSLSASPTLLAMSELTEIAAKTDEKRQIRLCSDLENLTLYLDIIHDSEPIPIDAEMIKRLLAEKKIELTNEYTTLFDEFIADFNANPRNITEHLLFSGRAPVHGIDAPVSWEIEFEKRALSLEGREKINIHEVTSFFNVDKGQVILRLGDPTPGVDGIDIYGGTLVAREGSAMPFEAGVNVQYIDPHTCVATNSGAIQIKGKSISISPVYNVDGDVDFSVGNIDYKGAVFIKGNICDGFSVKSEFDVIVGGSIEVANVETGGNLTVMGAILTRGKGTILVDGSLEANYINSATVDVGGDILVHKSILDSNITCKGKILVENGAIIGGTLRARHSVHAGTLGSKMSARTAIIVGPRYNQDGGSGTIDKNLKNLEEKIKKLETTLRPFEQNPAILERLPQDRRDVFEKITMELMNLEAKRDKIQEEMNAPDTDDTPKEIIVRERVFPNVEVQIGYSSRLFNDEIIGPAVLVANEARATISASSPPGV
ncbi:MAG: FapA family protein [Candidatus Eisenbacteria bacterium]|nr:FapA family protein [Candidatus Eisenbacteria bacterium]